MRADEQSDDFRREPTALRAELLDLLAGFMRTQALATFAKLGVADVLSSGPRRVEALAEDVGADEAALYRLLRYLATIGVADEVAPREFASTPHSDAFRRDAPLSVRWIAIAFAAEHYRAWGEATHSFLTGQPSFDRAYGRPYFDHLASDPEASENFDRAMAASAQGRSRALVEYDWSEVDHVVDLGGGTGTTIAAVLAAHPRLRGTLFDLPTVVAAAPEILKAAAVEDRCAIVGGDFFADPLPSADAYVLTQILHDWSDERASAILANCRRSIADDGRLLVQDAVLAPWPEPDWFKLFDLHMLVLVGGKERTEEEWRQLLEGEGFALARIVHSGPTNLLEARPR